jgi:hypothetical protein
VNWSLRSKKEMGQSLHRAVGHMKYALNKGSKNSKQCRLEHSLSAWSCPYHWLGCPHFIFVLAVPLDGSSRYPMYRWHRMGNTLAQDYKESPGLGFQPRQPNSEPALCLCEACACVGLRKAGETPFYRGKREGVV